MAARRMGLAAGWLSRCRPRRVGELPHYRLRDDAHPRLLDVPRRRENDRGRAGAEAAGRAGRRLRPQGRDSDRLTRPLGRRTGLKRILCVFTPV